MRTKGMHYSEIGKKLGISLERARQLALPEIKLPWPPADEMANGQLLKSSEVAKIAGVLPITVARWAKTGRLRAFRIGPQGWLRFRRGDVEAFVQKRAERSINNL
jgi:hypothetical protein